MISLRAGVVAILLAGCAGAFDAVAQARNAVYGELGGSGIVPTVNYERRMTENWYGRAGLSLVVGYTEEDTDTSFVVPLTASWVSRPESNHHLEAGGGVVFAFGDEQDFYDLGDDDEPLSSFFVTGLVGYRYQRPAGGFQFRAVFTPVAGGGDFLPWAGVSFGYAW